jgi:type I restriction enzyme S subunit
MSYKEEWKEVKIKEITDRITSGGTPSTRKKEYYNGTIPWLKTQEINFGRIYETKNRITKLGLKNSSAKWIETNSVIMAMYGATAGKVAINKIRLATNQACCNITLNPNKANYEYLYYFLCKDYKRILNLAVGAAQQNLSSSVIKELKIELPSLSTQNRIASILSAFDDKIEVNRQMNATLEAMAQAMFREMCLPKDEEKLEEGWEWRKIGDLYRTKSGGTPRRKNPEYYENGEHLWVKSKELRESFVFDTEEKITEEALNSSSAKLIPPFSLLVAMYGATVGQFSILGEEASCNQAICAIMPNKGYKYSFIYSYLKEFRQELMNRAVGSAQQNISQIVIKQFEITCPPKSIVNKFQDNVEPYFLKILSNLKENQKLSEIRDNLLPKLMSGKIEV